MMPGDCGSAELPAEEISATRRREGAAAAALIGATYHCLEERDLLIFYNERALERVTRLLRAVRPDVVLTHSPADYMLDHEMTSTVVRAAAFGAPIPNFHLGSGHAAPWTTFRTFIIAIPSRGRIPWAARSNRPSASTLVPSSRTRRRCSLVTPASASG